jgi:hypothetical protein
VVEVTFDNGNLYSPVYHHAVYISDEVKEEIQGSYENAHVLIYDTAFGQSIDGSGEVSNDRDGEGIKVFFTEEKGFTIDYATGDGSTTFVLKPDNSVEITNPNGDRVLMSNDGNITFTHSGTVTISADADLEVNCVNATITASSEAHIDAPRIKLGTSAAEAIIKGDTFKDLYNNHTHPTPVGPTGTPIVPMDPALSQVNTTD